MRNISRKEDLCAGVEQDFAFQADAVINGAFAFQQVRNRLDVLMIMGFGRIFMQIRRAPTVSADAPAP